MSSWFLWGGLLTLVVVGLLVYFEVPIQLRSLLLKSLSWIEQLGVWGPILFVLFYVLATVLFVPSSVLTLGAGAVFGILRGSIYASIAATLGALAAFLIGRYLARDWVARKIQGNSRFASIDRAVGDQGWKIVGLTRLSPIFPYTFLNYAFGLTQVGLSEYFFASWIGMLPGTMLYVYLGSLVRVGATANSSTAEWILRGVGLAATILVTVLLTRIARRALAQAALAEPDEKQSF